MVKHMEQVNNRATAPFNFIPISDKVIRAVKQPHHDLFNEGEGWHSGYLDVWLTTEWPLFIRGPMTQSQFNIQQGEQDNDDNDNPTVDFRNQLRNKPEFFHTGNPDQPTIPGSSLRGMLRTLVEIVTYSKLQPVTKKNLFYRTVSPTSIGDAYRKRMANNVQTGFLQRSGLGYCIQPCDMVRIDRRNIPRDWRLYTGQAPNKHPDWKSQHKEVWVKIGTNKHRADEISDLPKSGWQHGILVIAGDVPKKKKEFVFLLPPLATKPIAVPDWIIERFHDDDQITQWQQQAFPKDKPAKKARKRDGLFEDNPKPPGTPVFFLEEKGELAFLGRAFMFRLPYLQSPHDVLPKDHRDPLFADFAEAMFGYVREKSDLEKAGLDPKKVPQGDKRRAYAGRVYVTDAVPTREVTFFDELTPSILASPKPTAFQHYLVQTTDNERRLNHYDSPNAALRGHKLYWHQGRITPDEIREATPDHLDRDGRIKASSTQHTLIKPIRPDNTFHFRIYFENLHSVELGALLWVLSLPGYSNRQYRHKLGMGKPLGMGAVKLEFELTTIDRRNRYQFLFARNAEGQTFWHTAVTHYHAEDVSPLLDEFEAHILDEVGGKAPRLREVERIKMFLKMHEWREDDSYNREAKQYMPFGNRRPVLPNPLDEIDLDPPAPIVDSEPVEPTLTPIGEKIVGEVFEIDDTGNVWIDFSETSGLENEGVIAFENLNGKQYQVGSKASCIVIAHIEYYGDMIVECEPANK